MNYIRYFFGKKLAVYAAFSALLSLVLTLVSGIGSIYCIKLFFAALIYLWIVRLADDYSDFEKDRQRKKMLLDKKQLLYSGCILGAVYVAADVVFFGIYGAISVVFIAYIPAMEKLEWLKPLLLPAVSAYYLWLAAGVGIFGNVAAVSYLLLCLAAAIVFSIYKRRKRQ